MIVPGHSPRTLLVRLAPHPTPDRHQDPTPVSLTLPARAASVGRIRGWVTALAETAGLDEERRADVGLAVTEACTNVTVHAYRDTEPGTIRVSGAITERGLEVSVLDAGHGMHARPDSPGMGLGLPLMVSLTSDLEFRPGDDGGTEIWMLFATATAPARSFEARTG